MHKHLLLFLNFLLLLNLCQCIFDFFKMLLLICIFYTIMSFIDFIILLGFVYNKSLLQVRQVTISKGLTCINKRN